MRNTSQKASYPSFSRGNGLPTAVSASGKDADLVLQGEGLGFSKPLGRVFSRRQRLQCPTPARIAGQRQSTVKLRTLSNHPKQLTGSVNCFGFQSFPPAYRCRLRALTTKHIAATKSFRAANRPQLVSKGKRA
jgi:hypothetical protein